MAKKLVLVVKSSDKSGAVRSCVSHESMIAGEEAVWEREWTVCQVVAGGVALRFPHRHM